LRVRQLTAQKKRIVSDTGWKSGSIPPRESAIFTKTRPAGNGWRWRSGKVETRTNKFVLFAQCHPGKENWKAWLIMISENGPSIVGRLEHHGTHPGLHLHTHCERSGIEVGGSSINNLVRIPDSTKNHRRASSWTESGFWEAAKKFFRIYEERGDLL
jgi:hypothetical protein